MRERSERINDARPAIIGLERYHPPLTPFPRVNGSLVKEKHSLPGRYFLELESFPMVRFPKAQSNSIIRGHEYSGSMILIFWNYISQGTRL